MIGRRRLRTIGLLALVVLAAASCGGPFGGPLGGPVGPPEPDPNVRGGFGGGFFWAVAEPTLALDPLDPAEAAELVAGVRDSIDPQRDELFPVAIVATFPTRSAAEDHATLVRELLQASATWYEEPANRAARAHRDKSGGVAPLTPAERAVLEERHLAPGDRGVGWGGAAEAAHDAVYSLGSLVVVSGLKAMSWDEVDDLHPLAHLLAAGGADVVLEGDRSGEGSVIADVSCAVDDAAAGEAILDELGDAVITGGQFHARPPWVGPRLTDAERLARATYRRYSLGMASASFGDDELWSGFAARYLAAGSDEERLRISEEIGERMEERGVALIDGEVDPGVLALILDIPMGTDGGEIRQWTADVGSTMGQLPLVDTEYGPSPTADDSANLVHTGALRLHDGRLEIGWLAFGRFAIAMPQLAGYLTENGCTDIRVGIVDFDAVRGD